MSDDGVETDGSTAMLRQLMARRTRPGMVDIAGVRQAGGAAAAGLGLAYSPIARRLAARRSGDGGAPVVAGELVHPIRRGAGPDPDPDSVPADADDQDPAGAPGVATAVRPAITVTGGATSAREGPALSAPTALDTAITAASLTAAAASDNGAPLDPSPAGASAAPSPSPPDTARPGLSAPSYPRVTADDGVEGGDLPLAPSTTSLAAAGAGRRVGAPPAPMEAATIAAPAGSGVPSGPTLPAPALPVSGGQNPVSYQSMAGASAGDLSERIQRDLRRRIEVERERQGLPRWKR